MRSNFKIVKCASQNAMAYFEFSLFLKLNTINAIVHFEFLVGYFEIWLYFEIKFCIKYGYFETLLTISKSNIKYKSTIVPCFSIFKLIIWWCRNFLFFWNQPLDLNCSFSKTPIVRGFEVMPKFEFAHWTLLCHFENAKGHFEVASILKIKHRISIWNVLFRFLMSCNFLI